MAQKTNPYQITSRQDMEALSDSVNYGNNWSKYKHFKVINDITDSIRTITGRYNIKRDTTLFFQGNFNGNNKKITLAINSTTNSIVGIFGFSEGIINNLQVDKQW